MRTFAIGDIHGCLKQLQNLIKKLNLQKGDILIFLGDYIDRGPDSKGVLDFLMELQKNFKCIFLMGNHEDLFLKSLQKDAEAQEIWIYNGGMNTLNSFSGDTFWRNAEEKLFNIPDKYIKFVENMLLFYETETHFFVHAGVNPHMGIETRNPEHLLWIRDFFLKSKRDFGKIIVHGHTPTNEPDIQKNRIGIDTGCCFGGKLTCLILPGNGFIFEQGTKRK